MEDGPRPMAWAHPARGVPATQYVPRMRTLEVKRPLCPSGVNRYISEVEALSVISGVQPDYSFVQSAKTRRVLAHPTNAYYRGSDSYIDAILRFHRDPHTRQGVSFWPSSLTTCISALVLARQDAWMNCVALARSTDRKYGWHYDGIFLAYLTLYAAEHLGLRPGSVYFATAQPHTYDKDREIALQRGRDRRTVPIYTTAEGRRTLEERVAQRAAELELLELERRVTC